MKKKLLIAEKPSLKNAIKDAYSAHKGEFDFEIDFLAQAGHLVGLKLPSEIDEEKYGKWKMDNFPIDVPYVYHILKGKNDLVSQIKTAVKSGQYDSVIHAGDPDGEGELLVRLVLNYIGCNLPVERFWSNDITEGAVINALHNLKPDSDYDSIYDAALLRQHIDYQFGMNITGVSTLKMGELYKLGRVKAAIIRMLVDRELAIRNFVQTSTWKRAFTYADCDFVNADEFETEAQALAVMPKTNRAVVANVKDEIKDHKAPKLFKLSTLQTEAHKKLGFSGAQTLQYLQNLYEAKITSYPRTGCEYISSAVDLESIIRSISGEFGVDERALLAKADAVRHDKTYCNDKAIAEEGHTAVIPTGSGRLSSVGENERKLFELIARRFLAVFGDVKKVRNLTVTANPDGNASLGDYVFKESSDVEPGFELIIDPRYRMQASKGVSFSKGQELNPVEFHTKEVQAKAPSRYNDGSLIAAMEKPVEFRDDDDKKVAYKIGTPATRAGIIEECQKCGYFTKEKGVFYATQKAERIIEELGDIALFDVTNSGRWEAMLEQVRHGEANADAVENELLKECVDSVSDIKGRNIQKAAYKGGAGSSTILGSCPHCGGDVVSGKFGAYCSKKCGMQVAKAMGKTLTDAQVRSILSGKKTLVKGLTSKNTGKTYDVYLSMKGVSKYQFKSKTGETTEGYGYDLDMEYPKTKSKK